MALQQNIPTGYGTDATYWRITSIDEKFTGGVTIELAGYLDAAARQSGKQPMQKMYFVYTDIVDVNREICYDRIKQPIIEDGVDVNIFSNAINV